MRPEPSEVDLRLGDPRISPIRKPSTIISGRRAKPSEVQTHHHTHADTQHHKQQNNVQHRVSTLLWDRQSARGHAAKRRGLRFAPCGGRGILGTRQFSDISCHTRSSSTRNSLVGTVFRHSGALRHRSSAPTKKSGARPFESTPHQPISKVDTADLIYQTARQSRPPSPPRHDLPSCGHRSMTSGEDKWPVWLFVSNDQAGSACPCRQGRTRYSTPPARSTDSR